MKSLIYSLITILVFTACVETEFEVPDLTETESIPSGTEVSIASVLNNLAQSSEPVISYRDTDTYITGYVISSDVAGNFFRELIIQDAPENPTAGITLQLNQNALYSIYEPGRKVYVKLYGLAVAEENGVVQLGIRDGNGITEIPASLIPKTLFRSTEMAELIPLSVSITDISANLENLYISLEDAQFNRREVLDESPKTFAGEANDEFDGIRLLETCDPRGTILVSTSTFAKFKSVNLPEGRGSISGILSRDFYDDFYILRINTVESFSFSNPNRCDPAELQCGLAETEGSTMIFTDNFQTQTRNTPITGNG